MGLAQDKTERVLRDIHIIFSKAEPYNGSTNNVIVDRNAMLNKLKDLTDCMYAMMEEYELTEKSREKADRARAKANDKMQLDATRKAEDVYAASIMFCENSFNVLSDSLKQNAQNITDMYQETAARLLAQEEEIKKTQSNLKAILNNMIDTEKYLRLIDEENQRRAKEKIEGIDEEEEFDDAPVYEAPQIRVNKEYFEAQGLDYDIPEEIPALQSEATVQESAVDVDMDMDTDIDEDMESTVPAPFISEADEAAMMAELDKEWYVDNAPQQKKNKGFSLFGKK